MINKLKYLIWGMAMALHAIYMLSTGIVSFGWDSVEMNGIKLYAITIPYLLFALWVMIAPILTKRTKQSS